MKTAEEYLNENAGFATSDVRRNMIQARKVILLMTNYTQQCLREELIEYELNKIKKTSSYMLSRPELKKEMIRQIEEYISTYLTEKYSSDL